MNTYLPVSGPQVHTLRRKELIAAYPQIKKWFGPYPLSGLLVLLIVGAQIGVAWLLKEQPWYWIALAAYVLGAFFNHALYVLIHEAAHNLIFRGNTANKLIGMLADFGLFVPSAIAFRKFHLIHHQYLNELEMDPDVPTILEGRLIGNASYRKTIWLFLFSISQALRPLKVPGVSVYEPWFFLNLLTQIGANALLYKWIGPNAWLYLGLSTFFALGLHPLGGRWLQEHYHVLGTLQETYSYYGPLRKLMLHVTYHNEHHDFPMVAWVHLPKVYETAKPVYQQLYAHYSYTHLLLGFMFNSQKSPFSRMVRKR